MLDVIIVGLTSIVSIILLTAMCCKGNGKVKTGEDKVENSGSFTLGYIGNYLIREIFTCNHARHKQILS